MTSVAPRLPINSIGSRPNTNPAATSDATPDAISTSTPVEVPEEDEEDDGDNDDNDDDDELDDDNDDENDDDSGNDNEGTSGVEVEERENEDGDEDVQMQVQKELETAPPFAQIKPSDAATEMPAPSQTPVAENTERPCSPRTAPAPAPTPAPAPVWRSTWTPVRSFEHEPRAPVTPSQFSLPHQDGRIRNPVPSKLKGKTDGRNGNFSVMQIAISRPEMTARDLAAKRTSEGTEAAARLATTKGYRPVRRSKLVWLPPKNQGPVPPPQSTGQPALQPAPAPYPPHPVAYPPPPPPPSGTYVQRPPSQYSAQQPRPPPPRPPANGQPANRAPTALDTKQEQARLLTLLRSLHPVLVVDQICKGLAYFGGIPGAPPPADGNFPPSISTNGSGALFVGWIAEIFPHLENQGAGAVPGQAPPPIPAVGQAGKASNSNRLSVPVKRSRGRPKGSKSSRPRKDRGIKRTGYGAGQPKTNAADMSHPVPSGEPAEPPALPEPPAIENQPQSSAIVATAPGGQDPDSSVLSTPGSKKRGRPKGSKNRPRSKLPTKNGEGRSTDPTPASRWHDPVTESPLAHITNNNPTGPSAPQTRTSDGATDHVAQDVTRTKQGIVEGTNKTSTLKTNTPSQVGKTSYQQRNSTPTQKTSNTPQGQPSYQPRNPTPTQTSSNPPQGGQTSYQHRNPTSSQTTSNTSQGGQSSYQQMNTQTAQQRASTQTPLALPQKRKSASYAPQANMQGSTESPVGGLSKSQQNEAITSTFSSTQSTSNLSSTQSQQGKRRRISKESGPSPRIPSIDSQSSGTSASPHMNTGTVSSSQPSSAPSSFPSPRQNIIPSFRGNLNSRPQQQMPQTQTQQAQQAQPTQPLQQRLAQVQPQSNHLGQYQAQQNQQQRQQSSQQSPDLTSQQINRLMSSPGSSRQNSQALSTSNRSNTGMLRDQNAYYSMQRQQLANQYAQSAGATSNYNRNMGTASPTSFQTNISSQSSNYGVTPQQQQQQTSSQSMSSFPDYNSQSYLDMDYPMSNQGTSAAAAAAAFGGHTQLEAALAEPSMRDRIYHAIGRR